MRILTRCSRIRSPWQFYRLRRKKSNAECHLIRIAKEFASASYRVIKGERYLLHRYLLHHQLHSPANNNTTASSYVGGEKVYDVNKYPFLLRRTRAFGIPRIWGASWKGDNRGGGSSRIKDVPILFSFLRGGTRDSWCFSTAFTASRASARMADIIFPRSCFQRCFTIDESHASRDNARARAIVGLQTRDTTLRKAEEGQWCRCKGGPPGVNWRITRALSGRAIPFLRSTKLITLPETCTRETRETPRRRSEYKLHVRTGEGEIYLLFLSLSLSLSLSLLLSPFCAILSPGL